MGGVNGVVCWRPVLFTFPVCVFVLLRGVEKHARTQSDLDYQEAKTNTIRRSGPLLLSSGGHDCLLIVLILFLALGIAISSVATMAGDAQQKAWPQN